MALQGFFPLVSDPFPAPTIYWTTAVVPPAKNPSETRKVGVGIFNHFREGQSKNQIPYCVTITQVAEDSPFQGTPLSPGQQLMVVNSTRVVTSTQGANEIRQIVNPEAPTDKNGHSKQTSFKPQDVTSSSNKEKDVQFGSIELTLMTAEKVTAPYCRHVAVDLNSFAAPSVKLDTACGGTLVQVSMVYKDGPLHRILSPGDILLAVNGQPVSSVQDGMEALQQHGSQDYDKNDPKSQFTTIYVLDMYALRRSLTHQVIAYFAASNPREVDLWKRVAIGRDVYPGDRFSFRVGGGLLTKGLYFDTESLGMSDAEPDVKRSIWGAWSWEERRYQTMVVPYIQRFNIMLDENLSPLREALVLALEGDWLGTSENVVIVKQQAPIPVDQLYGVESMLATSTFFAGSLIGGTTKLAGRTFRRKTGRVSLLRSTYCILSIISVSLLIQIFFWGSKNNLHESRVESSLEHWMYGSGDHNMNQKQRFDESNFAQVQEIYRAFSKNHYVRMDNQVCSNPNDVTRKKLSSSIEYVGGAGLGHRLGRMAAAAHIAYDFMSPLLGFWGCCDDTVPVFSHLFGEEPLKVGPILDRTNSSLNHHLQFIVEVPGMSLIKQFRVKTNLCPIRPEKVASDYSFYRELRDRYRKRDDVDAFMRKKFEGKTLIGIHIRGGNGEAGDFKKKGRVVKDEDTFVDLVSSSIKNFVKAKLVERKPPILFVATDTEAYVRKLRASLQGIMDVVEFPQVRPEPGKGVFFGEEHKIIKHGSNCLKGWDGAIQDMIVLSQSDFLLIPKTSSFTQSMPAALVLGNLKRIPYPLCELTKSSEWKCFDNMTDWSCNSVSKRNILFDADPKYRPML